jgi:HSP20 family protein
MSVIRYNGNDFAPISFSHLVDKFFNESNSKSGGSRFVPRVDVVENQAAFELHVAAPGMNKEDFKVEVKDHLLTISGERKLVVDEKSGKNFRSVETQYGSFSRSFTLPENIDSEKIVAAYNNGILELTLPKDEKKEIKQSIKVN